MKPDANYVLRQVLILSQYSPLHQKYHIGEWLPRILPSIELNQFSYYEDSQNRPIGFCNWAFVSHSVQEELLKLKRDIKLDDWQSGTHLFVPEMLAPFGHAQYITRDLRRRVLLPWKGQQVSTIRVRSPQSHLKTIQFFKI